LRYKKKLTICVFGNTGRDDIGSEARLIATVEDIRSTLGDCLENIVILTNDEKCQKRFLNDSDISYLKLNRSVIVNPKTWLINIDAIVVSLDVIRNENYSPMDYWFFTMFVKTARMLGKKILLYAGHVEELSNSNRRMIRKALKSVGMVKLGNREALKKLKKYNVKNELFLTADNRYLYAKPGESYQERFLNKLQINPEKRPLVTVFPREYFTCKVSYLQSKTTNKNQGTIDRIKNKSADARESSARYINQISKYCDWLVEECNADVALVGLQRKDESIVRLTYETMSKRYRARMLLSNTGNVDDVCSLLANSSFQISGNIASCELGTPFGLPSIGIGSSSRLELLFRETGQIDNYIDYVSAPFKSPNIYNLDDELKEKSLQIFETGEATRKEILKISNTFVKRAEQNRLLVGNWLNQKFYNGKEMICANQE